MSLLLIVVLLFLLFGGGYYGYRRDYYGGRGLGGRARDPRRDPGRRRVRRSPLWLLAPRARAVAASARSHIGAAPEKRTPGPCLSGVAASLSSGTA